MLQVEKVYKSFGGQVVLKDINLTLRPKERIGVIGHNGAGKSTLVKIMAGVLEPDKGSVTVHNSTVGYLSQESQCRLGVTIGAEMRSALPGVADAEARLLAATHALESGAIAQVDAIADATEDLERFGGAYAERPNRAGSERFGV